MLDRDDPGASRREAHMVLSRTVDREAASNHLNRRKGTGDCIEAARRAVTQL